MRRRPSAALLLFVSLLAAITLPAAARAQADSAGAIAVSGNRHTDAAMIRSYFHAMPGRRLDAEALDAALKALYATGSFSDVKIDREGSRIAVIVVENPTIAKIAIEGNKRVKDAELKKVLQSKEGGPLSRFYIQADVEHMLDVYRQHGYFQAQITPERIDLERGGGLAKPNDIGRARTDAADRHGSARVNLVFAVKEGDKLAVRKILFAGNRAFPDYKLSGAIKTGKTNFLSFLLDNDIYNADKIENDCDLLRRFYLDHGYADVRVHSAARYDAREQGVVLTFTLDEGKLYHFGKVEIRSDLKAIEAADYRLLLRTQSGADYDAEAVNRTVDDLTMALAKHGQPFASVAAHAERVPPPAGAGGAGAINLVYTIDQGKRLYVERIEIRGNTKTRDDVIRREFDFGEGDAYNRALISRAERRLKALGYFKTVKIETEPGSAPDRVVLAVDVQEQDTGNFSIAGGYSTATGMMVQVGVSDRNLMGTGDIGKVSVTYGQYAGGLDLAFTDPYFLGQRLSAGIELFGNETFGNVDQSFNSSVYGAKFSLGTPLSEQLGVTWNYSIYNQSVSLDPAEGVSSLPIQQAAAVGAIWVSSIGATVTYSTLDDPKNPTSGLRVQTSNEFAGLGGAAKFAKTTEDVRYYHPVVGDVVGELRAQGGYAAPWGGQQLPLLDGFFGGPQLIRGFAPNGFGPRDITPGTAMDNIGGNVYWTSSAELAAPVPGVPADAQLKMALFSDVGSLWATGASSAASLASLSPSQQVANSHALRASVGTALIWDSPFGALEVDYAFPVAKQASDVTQHLNFTAGGF